MDANKLDLTVVIATLGSGNLVETLNTLNSGPQIPSLILVCIPDPEFSLVEKIALENVTYIKSPNRGQVFQRAFAFNLVNTTYTLQIDDDVLIDYTSIIKLIDFLKVNDKASVSPTLLSRDTLKYSNFMGDPKRSLKNKFIFWVINGNTGYSPGKISKSAINMGYNFNSKYPYEVDWIPGGCVLHHSKDLILENYYPFSGKAFNEDLIHSFYLSKQGIKLFHYPQATCLVDTTSSKASSLFDFFKINFISFKSYFYYANLVGGNKVRLMLFCFLRLNDVILVKFFSKISRRIS